MNAVILAAGRGRRLGKAADGRPKCLVMIGGRTILGHQLSALEGCGVDQYTVVVGYRAGEVIDEAKRFVGDRVRFVFNPIFDETNTSYSLWLALNEMRDSFFYLNGDVLFHREVMERLSASPFPSVLALELKECGDEEVKVELEGYRAVKVSKQIAPESAVGEFIGVAKFSAELAEDMHRHLERLAARIQDRQAYFEKGLEMTLDDHFVSVVDVTDLPAIEIDFPEDLRRAREIIMPGIRRLDLERSTIRVQKETARL